MRNISINSVKRFREQSGHNPKSELFWRGEPIFTKDGEPLTNCILFWMTDLEVVDCIKAKYQEQPNPLGIISKPMTREIYDAMDQLRRAGIDVRIIGVEIRK